MENRYGDVLEACTMIDLRDPLKLAKALWPNVTFYKQQREIIYSVAENDETFVPAGNMLGC